MKYARVRIGVLALQGDFERHCHQLGLLGVEAAEVRLPQNLEGLDGLIIPGGESTTMNALLDRFRLREPLRRKCQDIPVWGTCAGMIMLAVRIEDNLSGVTALGLLDIDVVRNGYGRQVFSFETSITASLNGRPIGLTATFIRAPRVTRTGDRVRTLAEHLGNPVLVSQGHILASAFHSELDDNTTLLEYFLKKCVGRRGR